MKHAYLLGWFLIIFCIGVSSVCTEKNRQELQHPSHNFPYLLTETFRFSDSNAVKLLPIDLENDGADELLALYRESKVRYSIQLSRNVIHKVLGQRNYATEKVTDIGLHFRTPRGEPRFCATTKEQDTAFLEVLDDTLGLVMKLPIISGNDNDGGGFWDGDARLVTARDINGDTYPDVIVKIQTFHDAVPRGIAAFDLKHQKKLWYFPTGTAVTEVIVEDLDNDGFLEVLFGGSALDNGATVNGTDDKHSYLAILSCKGELLWLQATGGIFSSSFPSIADPKSDGRLKIISIFQSRGPEKSDAGHITIRNARTRNIDKDYPIPMIPKQLIVSDLDFNGHQEIIVGGESMPPKISVFSDSLSVLMSSPLPFLVKDLIVEDLNDDGKREIIISNKEANKTLILSSTLEKLAESNVGGNLHILHQGLGRPRLLTIVSKEGIILFELKKSPLIQQYSTKDFIIGFIAGGLFIVILLFLYKSFTARFPDSRAARLLIDRLPIGVLWLDDKGNLQFCNPAGVALLNNQINNSSRGNGTNFNSTGLEQIKAMISNTQNSEDDSHAIHVQQETTIGAKEIHVQIFRSGRKIRNTSYIAILDDITERSNSQKALLWAALAQKLAHEIKNPLYTVLLTLQRLQLAYQEDQVGNSKTYDKYTSSIIEEVERLRSVTDGFMKFTHLKSPEYTILPAEALVKKVADRLREWLPDNVSLKVEPEQQLPCLRIDIDQIQRLFFNLFDNAIKAMDGKGRLFFRASLAQSINVEDQSRMNEAVVFEVSDTGCGIPVDKIGVLFEPYVSLRKGGTGLGLTISKKIVEDHGGRISIQSKSGVGTTVKVEIPVSPI